MREILDEIITYVEQRGAAVAEAVATLWPNVATRLTDDERDELAQRGLNVTVGAEFSRMRYTGPGAENGTVVRANSRMEDATPITVRVMMWERVRYETADGGTAPIIKFLVTDWESLDQRATMQAKGQARVAKFARRMVRTLKEHGTDRTGDLPGDVLAELAAVSPWATD